MGEQKLKPLNKGLTLTSMNLSRFSTILSNLQLAVLGICFIIVMGSIIYPLLSIANYVLAFFIMIGCIVFSLGFILLKLSFDTFFIDLIIFPIEVNEHIFTLLSKITPITSGILISLSIASFVTQTFFDSQRKVYRIIFSIIGAFFGLIGTLIEFY